MGGGGGGGARGWMESSVATPELFPDDGGFAVPEEL